MAHASSVTHYSIPEELDEGSIVANLATDLGLDVKTLSKRKIRLDTLANKKYLDINKETGELIIVERIDRELICTTKAAAACVVKLDVTIENPVRMFNIELEILDINDNAPHFRRDTMHLDISESTPVGERFSLNNAIDPDIGVNSIKTYFLSESDHFSIEIQSGRDGSKFTDLILIKALDREERASHNLILTAVDGGVPARSGTASIIVRVLDTNDNAPRFDKESYTINLSENSPVGSLVLKLNATDRDEGSNADLLYSYSLYTSEKTQQTFSLNPNNGEIRVREMINYEDFRIYDMEVTATDKGANSLSGKCKVKILISDMNDNHPEISIKSFSSPVKEDVPVNTVIAVVSVSDKDSGENGQVDVHISDHLPFTLKESSDNYYQLLVSEPLDREKVPEYDITITVTDRGVPPLSDNETITLELLDVNDNIPQFPQSSYRIPVMENNAPGASLSSITAFDPDLNENQYLVYFILEKEIANTSMSMLFSINPENGNLYALKTFDYEMEKEFQFHIEARDSGVPPLSSNVSVHVIIMDQNDNTPLIVSPWRPHGSEVRETIPRSTDKGTLISKVIAIDSDSVHNSRITYQFLQNTDATLFSLDQYNGEIRTMRMFSYRDSRDQRLVVIAKDNGEPALSATVTIKLSTVETAMKTYTEVPLEYDIFSDLNLYLVIGLGSVSFLLLITILVTIVLKCQKAKPSKAAPPSRNSVISERNSTIADSTLVSNDAYWYSLFLAETRKGKLVVRQPVPKGSRYIVSSIPRSTGLTETSDSAASTLQKLFLSWSNIFAHQKYSQPQFSEKNTGMKAFRKSSFWRYVDALLLFFAFLDVASSVTHYSIPEEMEEGSVVANLAADLGLDVKTLSRRQLRLDIISNKKYLEVNKETGELYILQKMDREYLCIVKTATCFIKMEVILENPERIFNIEIEILDINDNSPHFRRDTIRLDISESTAAGERFSLSNAVDPDIGSNSVKTYYLSENQHFGIEIQTGRDGSKFADLILKKTLDREEIAVHNLILTAVDGGVPARSGTASIIVRVLDTNDNAPRFDKESYTINLSENSPVGSLVLKLNATDRDEGSNADLLYSYSLYTSEKTQQTFSLNPNNGEIRVREMINYEDFRIYDMEVTATDKGANSLSGKCKVKILISDMNDNHPEISIKSFSSPVKEDVPVNTVIAVVSVSDKDSGENGQVDVHISDHLPFTLKESSDNYYQLLVSEPLDREKVPEYDITITVTDRGVPPLSDNETITLELLDVNDNIPQFPQSSYRIPVMENNAPGASLSSITAFDPDLNENQYLVYFILEKEIANTSMSMLFSINPENGNLYALKTFDYEMEKEFQFHIEARDSGVPPLSSNVSIHVIIMDQNDNTPLIVSPWRPHGSEVRETIPRSTDKGTLISKVIAIDSDSVHNSRITYQFLQNTDATLFSLDQYNGEIRTMRMFSYRDSRDQRLVVIAKDNGEPALSATVTIKLSTVETAMKTYTEVPLEYDIFSDLNLYLVIGLGSVSFLLLITILVTIVLKCQKAKPSKAAPPSRNSVISERNSTIADSTLVSNDAYWYSLFLAETRKGKLVVRQPVPKGSRYIVSSIPRSTGLTETSDSAASTLQRTNIYELNHVNYGLHLTDPHHHICALEAEPFHCAILLYEERNCFVFPSMELEMNALLWRRYVSLLFLSSALCPSALAVTHYTVPEEMQVGSVVANLATDLGLDIQTLIKRNVRLDVIANKKYLAINKEKGELYIQDKIDREYLCPAKTTTTCFLKMEVIVDSPVRIFYIELEITDINDNNPHFRRDTINLDITESTAAGERFSVSNAVDSDVGSNSVKTYYLSENEHFDIEIQSGRDGSKFADLILKKALDRETQATHNLILTAVDGGVPARSGTASIIVRVLDANDNAPKFYQESYSISLTENSPIGSLVVKLNATDEDEGSNAELVYSFSLYTSEKTQNAFSLNPDNGEIRVKEMLNYEDFRIYNMEVIATDKGSNPLSGQCKLAILISDMNDNHPEISIKSFSSPVKEDVPVNTVIAVVSVSDKDSGENGQVDVHISDHLPFTLKESSDNYYQLLVSEPLDREKVPEYDITITVTDRGVPPLSDNETITLELLDVNDNIPQFPQSSYRIPVMENNAPGASLSSITAFDPDLNENQYLVYFILEKEIANTSMSMLFSINPENGNLYALKTFDYEMEKEFQFHIEARDSGVPPLSSNVSIHVIIMDQNDNTPLIVSPWRPHGSEVRETIPRSTDKGTLISKVIAIDSDSVHNSRITYQFLQNTDATLFSLDQYNGEIRTMRMFSYRDSRDQRLVVIAKDNGEPALSATVTIKLSTVETAMKTYTEVPLEYDIFSDLNLYLVIGLGSVSFLLLITILVTIVLKCQKAKPSKAAPPSRNSVISERNSTIADSTLVSNDAYWYSLFLAETRKGKLVVRQPVPKGSRYIVSSIPRSTGLTETSDSAASTLQKEYKQKNINMNAFRKSPFWGYVDVLLCFCAILDIASSVTHYSIPEEMEEGSVVANLAADLGLDVKTLSRRQMRLDIISNKKFLAVNKETGDLYILQKMDREYLCISKTATTCFIKMEVILENPERIFNIEIEIVDINDNAPQFRRDKINLDISESTAAGERFSLSNAVDPDIGSNSVKTYYLSENKHFDIEIQSGRDGSKFADLILKSHSLTFVSTARSCVTHYSVPEEMEVGSVVANLAVDLGLDVQTLGKRKLRLDILANKKYLDMNKETGELFILERIDREYLCTSKTVCYLKMEIILENPVRIFNIELEIMDINDNAPYFRRDTIHLDISESTSSGERFSLSNAVDPDIGSNSIKGYQLSESANFDIEVQTGRDGSKFADLILRKALDREEIAVHNLILTAVDGGVPARSGTASIIVRVLDTNDNAPRFDKESYTINLSENSPVGSLVLKLNATDRDEGSNADLLYSYSLYTSEKTQQTFSLNPNNGEIRVREMINYEDFRIYDMEVTATDKGANSLSGKCKVKILISDMNDNHPEISIKSFSSPVKEDVPVNTVIAVVSVSDKDSGENGQVDVHISDHLPFTLKESSDNYYQLLVSEPLDREKVPEYDITITVTDRGVPPLSDNETITLELLDVNDNIPQFPQSSYRIPVMENNAPGALLSSITALDPDLNENQYLVYFIIEKEIANTSMSMLFSINPENGNLYALRTFDYEMEKEFVFHIEARDSGVPPLSSNVSVHVIIMDQNDNTPLIVSPWRAQGSEVRETIPRSTDKGTLISKVIAIDSDSVHNSRITYQFLQNTDATLFSLDQYNGEIRTMRMFSYRDSRDQRLVVIAKDNGEPALSATVTIKLSTVETAMKTYTEVPLEYDIFSDLNLYLVIGLGSVSFLLLITILVTIVLKCQKAKPSKAAPPSRNSVISERNSTIADSTLVSNDAYWYSLFLAETRKGKLVVRQPVPKGSRYIVSSIPRSTGLTETSDSAASTLQINYSVQEESKIGVTVGNIAKDLGIDFTSMENRNLRIVSGTKPELLHVHRDGALFVNQRIDREELCAKTNPCLVNLKAVIENPLEMHHISVNVLDVNDNAPSFMENNYILEILESAMPGARFQVEGAHDPDVSSNDLQSYKISQNQYFRLETEDMGDEGKIPVLILQKPLDREKSTRHHLVLTATDGGKPQKSSAVNITILVSDVNDNTPVCDKQKYTISVREDVPEGTFLLRVNASDADEGINGDVEYALRGKFRNGASDVFVLDHLTGDLKIKGWLDFEERQVYELKIVAADKGVVSLSTQCNVVVNVEDVNDNRPEIEVTSVSSHIPEDSAPGTVVALIGVTDLDSGMNGKIICSLSPHIPFDLKLSPDGNFYSLVTKEYIDKESKPFYNIIITAKDLGTPSLSSVKSIHVEVMDVNDNNPAFTQSPYTFYIAENNVPGMAVFSVSATDLDEGENARVSYSIDRGSSEQSIASFLSIKEDNGTVYSLKSFDFETLKTFQFYVIAKDYGSPPLSSNVTVKVFILDQNDNAPVILFPLNTNGSSEGVEEIPRNVNAGHLVTKVRAYDADVGYNGWLLFSLQEVSDHSLFALDRYTGQIRSLRSLTETDEAQHKLLILVKDNGNVSLSATATVIIKVVEPKEAFSASDAPNADRDEEENHVSFYLILTLGSVSVLFVISIIVLIVMQCSSCLLYTSRCFHILATDSGSPSLSSNVTVKVFILDQNDNAPVILYPLSANGSSEGAEEIPRNVNAGHLVTKVRAFDADVGYNGWLLFSLQEVSDHSLFALDRYTGQIRSLRSLTETDEAQHKLLILVKDNGNVSLSATATVIIKVVEPKEAFSASDAPNAVRDEEENHVSFYLILTLGSVSVLFVISIIVLIVMQCSRSPDYSSKYLQDTNYDGTLCHSIQYRSGDKRYMLVSPRMSIGSTLAAGSTRNTLLIPDRSSRRDQGEGTLTMASGVQGRERWILSFSLFVSFGCHVSAQIRYTVPEEVKEGAVVGNIAKDLGLDISTLANRRLRIVSGSKDALFQVNPSNGVLYILKKIDREELCDGNIACSVNLKIVVDDPLEIHYVAVEISDVNDNPPTFPEEEQHFEIAEHTPTGTRFQMQAARDADTSVNNVKVYKLSHNDHFDVEMKDRDGEKIPFLVLKKALDREKTAEHKLTLTAVDGGSPPRSGNLNIIITVLDINDNRPLFSQDSYSVTIKENAPIGTVLMKLNASDLDEGANGEVEYAFGRNLKRKIYDLFKLDRTTGELQIKAELDFEESEVYKLDVKASDKGQPPLNAESVVTVKIIDMNDNAPEIELTSLSSLVSEDTKPGTVISLISISDKDSSINGKIVPSLSEDVPFELKPSFQDNIFSLVTKGKLDREIVSHYDVTIKVTDLGQPPLSAAKSLIVHVSDVNDNSPEFPQDPLELYLAENNAPGASIFSVSASDKDLNENAMVSYSIIRGDAVQGDMTIQVSDVNDNRPEFISDSLELYIFENNAPGASVFSVSALDKDLNENALITYQIYKAGGQENDVTLFLNINSESGVIYALKSFDFEKLKTFQFHILATDSGSPPLSSNVTVKVFILDQNDNAPVILYPLSTNGSSEGVEEIPRNVNAGHLVTKVRAYDADVGYNGWLLFSLQEVSDHSLFALDRYTGQIRSLRSLTETDEAQHKLLILVKDNGNVSLSATATVIVKVVEPKEAFSASDAPNAVRDEEENHVSFYLILTLGSVSVLFVISIIVLIVMQCSRSPEYSSKYLQDTNYDGTLCHSIQYRSGDKRYMLVSPRMSIGSTLAAGSTRNTLLIPERGSGRDQRERFVKTLFIVFSLVYGKEVWAQIRYSISEEQREGASVGNIAKDLGIDQKSLKERGFRIVSTSGESLFSLNQNDGMLSVNGKIDREEVCERSSPCLINLKIALENPLEIHYVTVEVLDVNDHAPSFPEREMRLEIWESALPGARFQLQAARDPDSGSNSVHHYKLSHNDNFRLDVKDRGEDGKIPILVLNKPLDREVIQQIELQLIAVDGGKPSKSGAMKITITVLDINDNFPVFTKDVYSVLLNENSPVGTTVIQVNATDSDEGQNGEVFYSFGKNYEQKDSYEIDIQASDKGLVPHTTDKSVMIKIIDVNDNEPEIEVTSLSNSIPEDSRPGTTVALISVSDSDSGVNGKVSCSLSEDLPFKLMPSTQENIYSLVTTGMLDRETKLQYDVTLVAKDGGQPPLSSVKSITVMISDVNDNSPEFSSSPYEFYLMENNVPGASLFSVSASDKDTGENSVVSYQICRESSEDNKVTSFININSENGEVYALKSFDFETLKTFQFHILATDSGSPSLSSNVTVKVFILDQNDNAPVISYPLSTNGSSEGVEEIPRNVNAGHLVTKVRAYDADVGYNGWLLFSLQEVSDHSLFALDRYTGQIRSLRSLTETDEAQHKLLILVKDNGNVSLSATATVIVKVVEPKEAFSASDAPNADRDEEENHVSFYLILTLGSVSVLFVISIIVLIVMQCSRSPDYSSKYLQDTNYDGTLCHSIQYRSGDKRYMLVSPRMSIGSTLAAGSTRNTLLIPERCSRRDQGESHLLNSNVCLLLKFDFDFKGDNLACWKNLCLWTVGLWCKSVFKLITKVPFIVNLNECKRFQSWSALKASAHEMSVQP
ncbi:hypothetical protein DNTS_021844 [Danionella cerebrum]|uniref:Cadherin domain-containing protein n=1 Tax=Danionella cerebrum TaxID=2873325 RepID=A0A553PU60_9TELE|nr:hypothetical protein DNTS_021844 [Danionella translucida]